MTIVPKRQDALDEIIATAQRVAALERGCATGPSTEATAPAVDDDPNSSGNTGIDADKQDMKIAIVPRGIGTVRKSGQPAYPNGLYPLYGEKKKNYLQGYAVDQTTYVAERVNIQARVRTRVVKKVDTGAWSTLFHLPPGWWPTAEITGVALTALAGIGPSVTVPVRVTTEGHVQAQGPYHHPDSAPGGPGPAIQALDLRGLSFNAGGGACPGAPAADPTAAGDGRSWDFCDQDSLDPIVDVGGGGGGGGDGFRGEWVFIANPDHPAEHISMLPIGWAASTEGNPALPGGSLGPAVGEVDWTFSGGPGSIDWHDAYTHDKPGIRQYDTWTLISYLHYAPPEGGAYPDGSKIYSYSDLRFVMTLYDADHVFASQQYEGRGSLAVLNDGSLIQMAVNINSVIETADIYSIGWTGAMHGLYIPINPDGTASGADH